MRLALNRLAVAITAMVALAFLVPLAGVTRQLAHDRALGDARQQAAAIVTALAVDSSPALLARAVASTAAGGEGRLAVHLPGAAPIGVSRAAAADVAAVRGGHSFTRRDDDGLLYFQPSVWDGGEVAVIEVFIPSDELYRGVWPAWLALAGLAVVLVAGSTLFADRLGSRTVRATRDLADVTRRFGAGDLTVRAEPKGPEELRDAARNVNAMADNLRERIDAERELAADLSQSTGLGLDIAQRVARAAGGRLEISYGPLGGARVALVLETF
jgi:methyl-accepting chemotaxis protein